MSRPAVSIVMPIYNASQFLKDSLGGLVQQTLTNIEIVCVNDGSTDDSLSVIQRYAFQDSRIKIIDKDNSGYGNSMNEGIKIATGEYIGILEPDDFCNTQMFEKLYEVAKETEADVVKSNYFEYSQKSNSNNYFEVLEGLEYNKVTSAKENDRIIFMRPCIWSGIYKRKFLSDNNIVFNETPGASYQDTAFAFKVWVSANRVVFIKDAYLHYRIDNENSSVKSSGKIFSICDEFWSMQSFLNVDKEKKERFSKVLQALKLDSYIWNLDRIAEEYKVAFKDLMALEFLKADYENSLDKRYFDDKRWEYIQNLIKKYKEDGMINTTANEGEIAILKQRIIDLETSHSYRLGHIFMVVPGAIKRIISKKD